MAYFATGAAPTVMTMSPQVLVDVAAGRPSERVVAGKPADCPAGTGQGYVFDPAGYWRRAKCGEVGQAAPPGGKIVDQRPVSAPVAFGLPTSTLLLIGGVGLGAALLLLRRRRKVHHP